MGRPPKAAPNCRFERLPDAKPPPLAEVDDKAIVVVARKLLVEVWYVLSERVGDRHVTPEMAASKLMTWSWKLTDEQRHGLTSRQFIRYHLMRLKMGNDLTHFPYGGRARPLASVDEVLALRPELKSEA